MNTKDTRVAEILKMLMHKDFDVFDCDQVLNTIQSLDCCSKKEEAPIPVEYGFKLCKPENLLVAVTTEEKEETMYYDDENFGTYNDTHAQRTHLQHRATDIHCEKCAQFRKDFYINADESPRTPKEYVERIKAGKFLIGKGREDEVSWNPEHYIQWRDPNHPADEEGYKAAVTKVDDLYTKTNDDIAVLDPKDALQSLRVFEDTTFH